MKTTFVSLLLTCLTSWAGDTNWPHLAFNTRMWPTNHYEELPHRIRWHDGYYGPELVRVELATNVATRLGNNQMAGVWQVTNRVVNVIANGITNVVQIAELGSAYVLPTNYYNYGAVLITGERIARIQELQQEALVQLTNLLNILNQP